MREAASRRAWGGTWLYVFIVRVIALWPRISITTRGWTPWATSSEAQGCRRPWKRASGRLTCGDGDGVPRR